MPHSPSLITHLILTTTIILISLLMSLSLLVAVYVSLPISIPILIPVRTCPVRTCQILCLRQELLSQGCRLSLCIGQLQQALRLLYVREVRTALCCSCTVLYVHCVVRAVCCMCTILY